MLFVLIALWIIAAILLLSDLHRATTRWLSGVAFSGGAGALATILNNKLIPYTVQHLSIPTLETILYYFMATCSLISYYGLPYAFLMFAVHYNASFVKDQWKRYLPWILLLPIVLCLLFTPGYTIYMPISYSIVALWAIPYIGLGTYLIWSKKETRHDLYRTHIFTCLAVLPAVLFASVMNYVLSSFGIFGMWKYNPWIILFGFVVFIYTLFKYGILGVQFLIERKRLDYTLRTITSGTAILNHSIKNDIGKIRLFTDKMNSYAQETGQIELIEDIEVLRSSSQHIQDMINRVQDQTQDLDLNKENHHLASIIEQALQTLKPYLNHIILTKSFHSNIELTCDKTQITEVFNNIVMNAVDAMPNGGELAIELLETKKYLVIDIQDNGIGIETKDLKKVLEPFYTTKAGSKFNFGLGLAYCYSVLSKHGGTIKINSELGKGTTVSLLFPKKLVTHGSFISKEGRLWKKSAY